MDDGGTHADGPVPARRGGPNDLRVGDADRTAALSALDRHVEAGRLSIDEYGDRSAAASVAVTGSDIAALFSDLPAPHPPQPVAPGTEESRAPARRDRSHLPVIAAGVGLLVVVSVVSALALTGVHAGGFVFLPLLFLMFGRFSRHGRGPHA